MVYNIQIRSLKWRQKNIKNNIHVRCWCCCCATNIHYNECTEKWDYVNTLHIVFINWLHKEDRKIKIEEGNVQCREANSKVPWHWLHYRIINDGLASSLKCDDGKCTSCYIWKWKRSRSSCWKKKIVCLRWKLGSKVTWREYDRENYFNLLNLVTLMTVNYVLIKMSFGMFVYLPQLWGSFKLRLIDWDWTPLW